MFQVEPFTSHFSEGYAHILKDSLKLNLPLERSEDIFDIYVRVHRVEDQFQGSGRNFSLWETTLNVFRATKLLPSVLPIFHYFAYFSGHTAAEQGKKLIIFLNAHTILQPR